jgi:hypothetical protein
MLSLSARQGNTILSNILKNDGQANRLVQRPQRTSGDAHGISREKLKQYLHWARCACGCWFRWDVSAEQSIHVISQ